MATTLHHLIDDLTAEHRALLPAIADLGARADAGDDLGPAIDRLVGKLEAELDRHIAQEDDVLFPAYADASGETEMVRYFKSEHREILALRDTLLAAHRTSGDPDMLRTTASRLADLLTTHMTREDLMLFPTARNLLD